MEGDIQQEQHELLGKAEVRLRACLCGRSVFPAGLRKRCFVCLCHQHLLLWSASTPVNILLGFLLINVFHLQTRPADNFPPLQAVQRDKKTFQKQLHCMPDEILMIRFGYKQEKMTMEQKKEKEVKPRLLQEDVELFQAELYSICSSQRSTGLHTLTQRRVDALVCNLANFSSNLFRIIIKPPPG